MIFIKTYIHVQVVLLKQSLLQLSSPVSMIRCRVTGKLYAPCCRFFSDIHFEYLKFESYRKLIKRLIHLFLQCMNPDTVSLQLLTEIGHFSYSHHVWPVLKCLSKEGICYTKNYTRPEKKDAFVRPCSQFPWYFTWTQCQLAYITDSLHCWLSLITKRVRNWPSEMDTQIHAYLRDIKGAFGSRCTDGLHVYL